MFKDIPVCPLNSYKNVNTDNTTSCYTFHSSSMSWYDAINECKKQSYNGHLASISDQQEHDYLVNIIMSDIGNFLIFNIAMIITTHNFLLKLSLVTPSIRLFRKFPPSWLLGNLITKNVISPDWAWKNISIKFHCRINDDWSERILHFRKWRKFGKSFCMDKRRLSHFHILFQLVSRATKQCW